MNQGDDKMAGGGSVSKRVAGEPLLVDHRGQPLEIPPEGSLWLLALGWRGIVAWRNARERAGVEPADHLVYIEPGPENQP